MIRRLLSVLYSIVVLIALGAIFEVTCGTFFLLGLVVFETLSYIITGDLFIDWLVNGD